ncbi:MAG: Protein-export membrane protein SecF [Candidatus Diapherotrites archaeon ADurb.Bin253]|jgi:preprotein translocase subunit SecF|nr:MAG: Protein-export membrane protein SecF [Candidatus Diapherotrites archaeon ADurb.Bin253]HNZ52384.1 protein translocase subunit SecF [Candidatus Pacearchaeota archaeon]HPX74820.1 protein translocase subunit SecF [Candidatus Pacearchaeota archaeon]HQC61341.1 protein translocase subunit SecF [Candidatus Pacearchaeota archaeon]
MEDSKKQKKTFAEWHDKNYKKLLIIPATLFLFCLIYLGVFYSQHHDIFLKDISLSGGTSATINGQLDVASLEKALIEEFGDANTRIISDLVTGEQLATIANVGAGTEETKAFLEGYLGYKLTEENSSFEYSEPSFTQDLYRQLMISLLLAFFLMIIVIFILFRDFVPSITIVSCVFMNIIMTITVVNLLGIKISTGGIIAFLMIIGYSVDTDILLTNRLLKRKDGTTNHKIFGAFKTGLTMTLTSLFAISVSLLVVKSFSPILTQIFLIICIGLLFDMINTWITNVSVLKWHIHNKENKK